MSVAEKIKQAKALFERVTGTVADGDWTFFPEADLDQLILSLEQAARRVDELQVRIAGTGMY